MWMVYSVFQNPKGITADWSINTSLCLKCGFGEKRGILCHHYLTEISAKPWVSIRAELDCLLLPLYLPFGPNILMQVECNQTSKCE